MRAKEEVKAEIKSAGTKGLYWVGKELRNLHKYLNPEEKVLSLMSGFEGPTTVLVVLTNERVIFFDKNFWFGSHHRSIALRKLTSTEGNQRLFFATFTFYEGTRSSRVDYIFKSAFRRFGKVLSNESAKDQYSVDELVAEIEKLGALVEKGLLTKEEFARKKRALLSEQIEVAV